MRVKPGSDSELDCEASKFNPDRPAGHYILNLDKPYDKTVYTRLLEIAIHKGSSYLDLNPNANPTHHFRLGVIQEHAL